MVVNHLTPWFRKNAIIGVAELFDSSTDDFSGAYANHRYKFFIIKLVQGTGCTNRVNTLFAMTNILSGETGNPRALLKMVVNQADNIDEIAIYY